MELLNKDTKDLTEEEKIERRRLYKKLHNQAYYKANKEKFKTYIYKEKELKRGYHLCECGRVVRNSKKKLHLETSIHKRLTNGH